VAPFYPQATLVVLPIVFLLVLFTSSMLPRVVARVVAVEGLDVAVVVIVADPTARDLMAAELFFVVVTLAVVHELLVRSADAQAELVGRLEHAARIDALTGLLTRRAFEELVADELAAGRSTALVLVDVDGFKGVNDTHGHPAGDVALQHVAGALTAGVRSGDAVAGRLGGDEFAVVLRSCSPDAARRRAEELVVAVAERPVRLASGVVVVLGVSVGVATADAGDVETLYAAADAALYAAKTAGRGRAVVATPAA
jgi:diguanylate cyclase (GGDEF)-like protein